MFEGFEFYLEGLYCDWVFVIVKGKVIFLVVGSVERLELNIDSNRFFFMCFIGVKLVYERSGYIVFIESL